MDHMKSSRLAYARCGLHRYGKLEIPVCKELKQMGYNVDLNSLA